jgi:hypothetical protein
MDFKVIALVIFLTLFSFAEMDKRGKLILRILPSLGSRNI